MSNKKDLGVITMKTSKFIIDLYIDKHLAFGDSLRWNDIIVRRRALDELRGGINTLKIINYINKEEWNEIADKIIKCY